MSRFEAQSDQLAHVEQLLEHFEQLEAQFQVLRDGLTHSHRLATLGTIASMVAHEYNNILTPIMSYAQLALAQPDNRELTQRALEKAIDGAQRAAQISSSMLGFAREDDTGPVAQLEAVIRAAGTCLGRPLEKDGIRVTIDVPDVTVAMSPLRLQQVFVNLMLNARQAMRQGGGGERSLTIRGRVTGDEVHIEVEDTGPGIPEAIIDRLFDPFVTHADVVGDGTIAESGGTGLGLCICRDLLQAAGGGIEAHSRRGCGATFHLHVPLAHEFETT